MITPGSSTIIRTFVLIILFCAFAFGQQRSVTVTVTDNESGKPVENATVRDRTTGASARTDAAGRAVLKAIGEGETVIEVVADGYRIGEATLAPGAGEISVALEPNEEEVVISTTRTGRDIENTPTRVESIDEEEIDEKSSMRSSNVSMILNESTGIKVQQTSATAFTQSVRIQGLDGRYTQLLKDGFPAFGGFSGSLGILDIVPLDLKQVEIVKGASSTFYGGGAIAGVVNFISKEPTEEPKTSLLINQTSALGTDVSVFHTRRSGRFGATLLGTANYQREYDADGDRFTELPRTYSFNFAPRLFVYSGERSRLSIGNSTTVQLRDGGDLEAIRSGRADRYLERHRSTRNITTFQFERDFVNGSKFFVKQSLAIFGRSIESPGNRFAGRQLNSFTELSYFKPAGRHLLVAGFNAAYDGFAEDRTGTDLRDEKRVTAGGFVQDTVEISERFAVEAGFRLDAVRSYGVFALPRISLLYRLTEKISGRASFGFGYKTPSIFTEEAETLLFRNVAPVGNSLKAETSRGATIDVNYRETVGEKFSVSLNQMFFLTEISSPLILLPTTNGAFRFANSDGRVRSVGFETNARLSYGIAKLFAGYTFNIARADHLGGDRFLPLTPRSKLNSALLFEKEQSFKAGIEAYFTGRQTLSDRSAAPRYWVVGVFGERSFGKITVFFNAENLTDTRQSRFGPVVSGPRNDPSFAEIFTHTEGRIFNGGVKIRL